MLTSAMTATTMSVLLVEDDEVVRASMCFALESEQISVTVAGSVAEGLSLYRDGVTDVVVIDLHLPDGSGYDLAMWLWRKRPQLPLVMISTDLGDTRFSPPCPPVHRRLALLAKPFSASELMDAISRATAEPAAI